MDKNRRLKRWIPLISILVLAGFCIYAALFPRETNSRRAAAKIKADIQKLVQLPGNEVKRFVEEAHRTVTVRSVTVTKCAVLTSDGSPELKDDLSNLKRVDLEITAHWDGWLHRGGETVVTYSMLPDEQDGTRSTPLKILSTTALYTKDDHR